MIVRVVCGALGIGLMSIMAWAQPEEEWMRTFGGEAGEECRSIIQTADGGMAMAGFTNSFGAGSSDAWLIKTNSEGDSLWSHTFGGRGGEGINSLIQTVDGGFALAGVTVVPGRGDTDFWLLRTNSDGEMMWSRTFGDEAHEDCASVIETADGGFALAGYTTSYGAGMADYWLVLTDENGENARTRTYGGSNTEGCNSLVQTADGGFALAGTTLSFGAGNGMFWLVRTNPDGDSLWSQMYAGGVNDYYTSLIITTDGGFALAGSNPSPEAGDSDFWLVRADSEGDRLWSRGFGAEGYDFCRSVIQTPDGGFALVGWGDPGATGRTDYWLVRTDEDGDSLWSCAFGGGGRDICYSLIQTDDEKFVMGGLTNSSGAGDTDFFLVMTNSDPVSAGESGLIIQPLSFFLSPAFPNPFNGTTTIRFQTSGDAFPTRLAIYDPAGRLVEDLIPNVGIGIPTYAGGMHSVTWNAAGRASGNYFVRMQAGRQVLQQPVVLVK